MHEAIDLARFYADVQPAPAELADAPVRGPVEAFNAHGRRRPGRVC